MPAAVHMLAAPTPPANVSRYRSLRGKSVSETRRDVERALDENGDEDDGGFISRIGSRHRKRSKTVTDNTPPVPSIPSMPSVPVLPLAHREANIPPRAAAGSKWSGSLRQSETLGSIPSKFPIPPPPPPPPPASVAMAITADMVVGPTVDPEQQRREMELSLLREDDERRRQEEAEAARWADEVARLEAETDRILAEQKKKDLARLQMQLATQHHVSPLGKPKSPVLEKFAFLTRGRRSNAATLSPTSSACTSVDFSRATSLEPHLMPRAFIEPRMAPYMDPPGANERQVQVRCKHLSMNLPVPPEHTTVDILYNCSDSLVHPINTRCSVVLEKYAQLGLERRLRRYERVRDVMNSWDRDTQNSLLVMPSDAYESDRDLDEAAAPAPDEPPQGFILQLHHSQRPGKWHKRFVTLLESGHMYAAKKPEAGPGPADRDARPLCHLSDFDIYTPTEAQMRKHLKPPKKYCYAVKSQQKTTLFESTENFVHFFSTEDPAVAHKFHALVHGWRSWHILRRRAEVARQAQEKIERAPPPQITAVRHKPKKSVSHVKVHGHRLKVSVDESPYAIGAFQPLLDLKRFDKPIDDFGKDWVPDNGRFSMAPPAAPKRPSRRNSSAGSRTAQSSPGKGKTVASPTASAFAANGLLGERYDARKTAAAPDNGATFAILDGPFTDEPTLFADGPASPTSAPEPPSAPPPPAEPEKPEISWFPSAVEHSAKERARAQSLRDVSRPSTSSGVPRHDQHHYRRPDKPPRRGGAPPRAPAPLVNLAPQFREAPQWSTEGRGRGVKAPPGTHLVDLATGPAAVAAARFLEVPPRGLIRREGGPRSGAPSAPLPPPPPAGRQRSKSTSAGSGFARRGDECPPVPPLPRPVTRDGTGGDPGFGAGRKDRGRDLRPREFAARGRSGTLKY